MVIKAFPPISYWFKKIKNPGPLLGSMLRASDLDYNSNQCSLKTCREMNTNRRHLMMDSESTFSFCPYPVVPARQRARLTDLEAWQSHVRYLVTGMIPFIASWPMYKPCSSTKTNDISLLFLPDLIFLSNLSLWIVGGKKIYSGILSVVEKFQLSH